MQWKLKRVRQCPKCPWRQGVNPNDIEDGYSVQKHEDLRATIADPEAIEINPSVMRIMNCHEHPSSQGVHCIGWLHNQLGAGNNIPLRLSMLSCQNAGSIQIDGPQRATFEETLEASYRGAEIEET